MSTTPLLVKSPKHAFIDVMLMPGGNLEAVEALFDCVEIDVFVRSMARLRAADANRRQMLGLVSPPQLMIAEPYTVRDMFTFQKDPFAYPMLRLHRSLQEPAVRLFAEVLRYMGLDESMAGEALSPAENAELLSRVFAMLGKEPLLRDEMFLQLQKQTRANDYKESCLKAWELMRYVAVIYPPTVTVATPLVDYFTALGADPKVDPEILSALKLTWKALEHGLENGPRQTIPTGEEVLGLVTGAPMVAPVFLSNDAPENIFYTATTTVAEAVQTLLRKLQVTDAHQAFAMYTSRATRPLAGMGTGAAGAKPPAPGAKPALPPPVVEHILLPRNSYVSDLLVEYGHQAQIGLTRGSQVVCKLLLRKRWFATSDADVIERQFVRLCYVQLRADFQRNRYKVSAQGAVVLGALQVAAEMGVAPEAEDTPEWQALMRKSIPSAVFPRLQEEQWVARVAEQYHTLWSLDHEGTMREFIRLLLDSPHGGSLFFPLRTVDDSAAFFPQRVLAGVNHNGMHFLNAEDFSLVHEVELRHIAEYAGRPGRLFLSLAVKDQLHSVEFTTSGGDEICELLDRHIANAVRRAEEEAAAAAAEREAEKPRAPLVAHAPATVTMRLPQAVAVMGDGAFRGGRARHA
eukprot:TRINITY_DN12479_c0_g1_i1.p1 TRINITY_DN12479_c0_g1~~TRINITY_DN12479_c0_g1_i1.p1  ORF type:complete len:631 (-),score=8.92 TRINITY_DN12479_c0_g1_i1:537-2429(-)